MAICVTAVVGAAPCQCFSPGAKRPRRRGGSPQSAALPLRPAAAGGDDQRLAERMRVPGGARARLEGDGIGGRARRGADRKQRVDAHGAGEPVRRPLAEGCEPLRLMSIGFAFRFGGGVDGWRRATGQVRYASQGAPIQACRLQRADRSRRDRDECGSRDGLSIRQRAHDRCSVAAKACPAPAIPRPASGAIRVCCRSTPESPRR